MAIDILGLELGVALLVVVPAIYLFSTAIRRYLVKGHVWFHIDLPEGRTKKGHMKPDDNGDIDVKSLNRAYHTRSDSFTLVTPGWALPEAPFFRYTLDDPWPLKPGRKAVFRLATVIDKKAVAAANGAPPPTKTVRQLIGYEKFLEPQRVPAKEEAVFKHQKLFADAYGGRDKLLQVLIILVVIILIALFVLMAKTFGK